MKKETLKRVFDFLEEKEGQKIPFLWKLLNNIPLTKEDLIVKGDLNLEDSEITSLPEGLTIEGDFFFYHTPVELPKGLKVDHNLDLKQSKIESLPEDLRVGNDLNLRNCKNLKSLPKGLKVGGDLYIINAELLRYTNNELKEMVKPGFIKGKVIREW